VRQEVTPLLYDKRKRYYAFCRILKLVSVFFVWLQVSRRRCRRSALKFSRW